MDSFEKFVRDVLDGKLEPYLKSEPVPDNDQPLKVRSLCWIGFVVSGLCHMTALVTFKMSREFLLLI